MGVARLVAPDACLARKGEGFKGLARGAAFKGRLRYSEIDRWKPLPVADHPYDLEVCDLCVRQCPIKDAIELAPVSNDPQDHRRTPVVKDACVGCGYARWSVPRNQQRSALTFGLRDALPEGRKYE
jgi:ferredoxin-type protein NapG